MKTASIAYRVECSECGTALDIMFLQIDPYDEEEVTASFTIKPCPKCLTNAYAEGRAEEAQERNDRE